MAALLKELAREGPTARLDTVVAANEELHAERDAGEVHRARGPAVGGLAGLVSARQSLPPGSTQPTEDAFFLKVGADERFVYVHRPAGAARGCLILLQPFAEEMNKCRLMAAEAARAFSRQGWIVIRPDLHGTGDSDADFGDATWAQWSHDVDVFIALARQEFDAPAWLWAIRGGALLAAEAVARHPEAIAGLLLWQPQSNGKTALTQFLRLQMAGNIVSGENAVKTKELRAQIAAGVPTEVAGYALSEGLCSGMESARFSLSPQWQGTCLWLEVGGSLAPASSSLADQIEKSGVSVMIGCVEGPTFWQSLETEMAPEAIERSVQMLECFT
jgi:exosortase A-associated hydrolase 2